MPTQFFTSASAIRAKYGTWAGKILASVHDLGEVDDISGETPDGIRARVSALDPGVPVCLVGGYDVIPPFMRDNPTFGLTGDQDGEIPTDAPYAANLGRVTQEYCPARAISRIPDGTKSDAPSFLKILSFQRRAARSRTPDGSFEIAAAEFSGAASFVNASIPNPSKGMPRQSPPDSIDDYDLPQRITGRGRIHILLHGSDRSPDWAYLFGHDGQPAGFPRAISARILDLCDLRGSIVTFGSCYAAMLDTGESEAQVRSEANQVALACLGHGAKAVIGATRANWISMTKPYNAFGPGLVSRVWQELGNHVAAAEALRAAKAHFLRDGLAGPRQDRPYLLKTALQFQCYGHPDATL